MRQYITDQDLVKFKDTILTKYPKSNSSLMQVLQESQKQFGCVPIEMQKLIGSYMNISTAKINGVVSFYSMFSMEPNGKYSVGVCLGTACYIKGGERLLERFQEQLGIKLGETTEDELFSLVPTRCVGFCSKAPVVVVNEDIHEKVSSDDVPKIIKKCKENE